MAKSKAPAKGEKKPTVCPVTKKEFIDKAKSVPVVINGQTMTAYVHEFSTGSFGWYVNGKLPIMVGEKEVVVQLGMNLTVVGSKEAKEE